MDKKGYVMSGMSFLLILPTIMLLMVLLDMTHAGASGNSLVLESGEVSSTAGDLKANIPSAGKEIMKFEAEKIIQTGIPLSNSRKTVKEDLQTKMDQITIVYSKNTGLEVACNITSVGNSPDPFAVQINSSIYVGRDNVVHQENLSQDISLIDPHYPISNPLPFIKCRDYGGAKVRDNRISFGSSLSAYLEARGLENAYAYENSTSSLIIKKCPNDPYIMHGRNGFITLKNCIENGYFHESSDGSCFLCRLEGKGTCPHYGFETFIVPVSSNSTANGTNLSINSTFNSAPSSIDHVIFNDTFPGGTYPGKTLLYYSDGFNNLRIFLDNSHRQKYGLPMF